MQLAETAALGLGYIALGDRKIAFAGKTKPNFSMSRATWQTYELP